MKNHLLLICFVCYVFARDPPPGPTLRDVECSVCVLALTELEGLASENITQVEMIKIIKDEICVNLNPTLRSVCEMVANNVPAIVDLFDRSVDPARVCLDIGACEELETLPADGRVLPVFEVNLDLPSTQRWVHVVNETSYWSNIWLLYNTVVEVFGETVTNDVLKVAEYALEYMPEPYKGEIKGIADTVGVPRGALLLLNIFYELKNSCTSIVAEDNNGVIYFSRNQDLGFGMGFTHLLRNDTIHVKFTKSGKVIYEAVTFAGYVGLPTGFLEGKFTVSVNARFYRGTRMEFIKSVLQEIIQGKANMPTHVVRNALEMGYNYQQAKEHFSTTTLITSIYYIMGGVQPGEGIIIARNQTGAVYTEEIDRSKGTWFVIQTNYDRNQTAPFYDDRKYYAPLAMNNFCAEGSKVSLSTLWDVLSFHPILNLQTLYTAQSIPGNTNQPFITHQRTCTMEDGSGCPL